MEVTSSSPPYRRPPQGRHPTPSPALQSGQCRGTPPATRGPLIPAAPGTGTLPAGARNYFDFFFSFFKIDNYNNSKLFQIIAILLEIDNNQKLFQIIPY